MAIPPTFPVFTLVCFDIVDREVTCCKPPNIHTISLFPALYEGDQPDPDFYVKPQLTYREDHPGRHLPALHFTFRVTES